MPINKEAYLRYRIIDERIRRKGAPYPKMDDLIESCEEALGTSFSVSTIQKDIKSMKEDELLGFKAPLKFSRKHQGYYYTDPDYSIGSLKLDDQDVEALLFAVNTLKQFKGVTLFNHFDDAVDKIFDAVNMRELLEDPGSAQMIQFEQAPVNPGSNHLSFFVEAIRDRKAVQFEYGKFTEGTAQLRVIHPCLLKEYRHRWYLIGTPKGSSEVRTYGLDRVRKPSIADIPFKPNYDFDPDTYFKHAYGITAFQGKAEKVRMRFEALQAAYIKTQPLHATQQIAQETKGFTVVEIEVGITIELIMDLLGYGDTVEVLAPDSLRIDLKNRLQKAQEQYTKK